MELSKDDLCRGFIPRHVGAPSVSDLTSRSPEQIVGFLAADLKLTTYYLKAHPKVYWIWNHRKWCLENVPLGPKIDENETKGWRNDFWAKELKLVEMMLDVDARNCEFDTIYVTDGCSHGLGL